MTTLLDPNHTPSPHPLPQPASTLSPVPPRSRWAVPALIALFLTAMAILSDGFVEHYDEVAHFLYARRAFSDPNIILNVWGRLGCTSYFGLFAPFGLTAARLGAVLATLAVAVGATIVLRHLLARSQPHPLTPANRPAFFTRHAVAFLWLLLIAQPFFTLFSFTVMTEMLLALTWIWTLATLTLAHRRPWRGIIPAAFILGLGGLVRPEGWVAIACWPAFAAVWMGRPLATTPSRLSLRPRLLLIIISTLFAGLPTLGWYLAGLAVSHNVRWFIDFWPWPVNSQFGKTPLLFLNALLTSQGVWLWPFILTGLALLARTCRTPPRSPASPSPAPWSWQADALLLLAAPVLGLYLLHGTLGSFGLFGSLSLPRYFICISPMSAMLALLGLIYCEYRSPPRWLPLIRITPIALMLLTLAFMIQSRYLPTAKNLATRRLDVACDRARQILATDDPRVFDARVIAGHPYVILALNMTYDGPGDLRTLKLHDLSHAAPGKLLIIDNYLWASDDRPSPATLESWGYHMDQDVARQVDALDPEPRLIQVDAEVSPVRLWIKDR